MCDVYSGEPALDIHRDIEPSHGRADLGNRIERLLSFVLQKIVPDKATQFISVFGDRCNRHNVPSLSRSGFASYYKRDRKLEALRAAVFLFARFVQ